MKYAIIISAVLWLGACDAVDRLVTAKGEYDDAVNQVSNVVAKVQPIDQKSESEMEQIVRTNPELKPLIDQINSDGKVVGVEMDALREAKRVSDATLNKNP